jgi:alcohol dehydrogenase (cytochrome c)
VVSTGGNVVFTGDRTGNFSAFDAGSRKLVYRRQVSGAIPGGLAVYGVAGKEYVAVVSGYAGPIWHLPKVPDKVVVFSL